MTRANDKRTKKTCSKERVKVHTCTKKKGWKSARPCTVTVFNVQLGDRNCILSISNLYLLLFIYILFLLADEEIT